MRFLPALAVPLVVLSFAGCATAPTDSTPQNAAVEQAPAFATDEEALAAAQAAYAEYLAVSDQILARGGNQPELIQSLVSQSMYEQENEGFKAFQENGWKGIGTTSFDTVHLQEMSQKELSVYLCVDHSNTKILNSDQSLVDLSNRDPRLPLVVKFQILSSHKLTIASSETWTGANFC